MERDAQQDRTRRLLSGSLIEGHLDKWAEPHHPIDVVAAPGARNEREDPPALRLVIDHARGGGQVGPRPTLQVKFEVRVCLEVAEPRALPGRRNAADVDAPIDVVKHDLDPAWFTR